MERTDLAELSAFATVAAERSFTRAAARLGVSQSALSHSIRGLEKRLGVQLLARTTRSVSATAAGSALLQELVPSLGTDRSGRRGSSKPKGAASRPDFASSFPVWSRRWWSFQSSQSSLATIRTSPWKSPIQTIPVDLVAGEYDAGVQLGEFIQRDMIAVPVTGEMRLVVVGSPAYLEENGIPKHPQDLKDHACIGFRFTNGLYRWEFEKGAQSAQR